MVISMPLLQIGFGVHFWPSKNRFISVYCFCLLGNGNINIKWFGLLFWSSLFFPLLCLWASYKKSEHVNIDIKSTNSHKNLSLFLKCNTDHKSYPDKIFKFIHWFLFKIKPSSKSLNSSEMLCPIWFLKYNDKKVWRHAIFIVFSFYFLFFL